jgi:hypothetical protein
VTSPGSAPCCSATRHPASVAISQPPRKTPNPAHPTADPNWAGVFCRPAQTIPQNSRSIGNEPLERRSSSPGTPAVTPAPLVAAARQALPRRCAGVLRKARWLRVASPLKRANACAGSPSEGFNVVAGWVPPSGGRPSRRLWPGQDDAWHYLIDVLADSKEHLQAVADDGKAVFQRITIPSKGEQETPLRDRMEHQFSKCE